MLTPDQHRQARANMNFLALDLEMTQPSNRIIQIGICIGNRLQHEDEYVRRSWLISPGEPLAPRITTLTGITEGCLSEGSVPHAVAAAELGALVVEHTCFVNPVTWGDDDAKCLRDEFSARDINFPMQGHRVLDVKTVHAMRMLSLGISPVGGLGRVMHQHYKMPFIGPAHRADVDAFNTLRLFFRMQSILRA